MCADFLDLAVAHAHDLVRVAHGAEPVRDHQHRAALHQRVQRLLDLRLVLAVQRTGRLVEHQEVGVGHDCARDGDALPLPARQVQAAAAHARVQAAAHLRDEVAAVGDLRGLLDLAGRPLFPGLRDVLHDAVVEESRTLRHDGHARVQAADVLVLQLAPVERDRARQRFLAAHEQVGDRGLA